jgi:hypothetical protein
MQSVTFQRPQPVLSYNRPQTVAFQGMSNEQVWKTKDFAAKGASFAARELGQTVAAAALAALTVVGGIGVVTGMLIKGCIDSNKQSPVAQKPAEPATIPAPVK